MIFDRQLMLFSTLRFRELSLDDLDKLFEIYSDKEAMKYRGSKAMETKQDALLFLHRRNVVEDTIQTIRKAVELLPQRALIGTVMYRYDKRYPHQCEIGYSIGKQY